MADAGLDPDRLLALLPSARGRADRLIPTIAAHLDAHDGYVAWSGGKDSTAVVDLARQARPDVPICFFNSGLEFPETLDYVATITDRLRLNLHIIDATPDALSMLAATGAWDHNAPVPDDPPDLHQTLIVEPARRASIRFGAGELSGLRAAESAGRRALLAPRDGTYQRANGTIVCAPIWAWNEEQVTGHLARRGLPLNPVYGKLRALGATGKALRVGLMLDGNGLQYGRVTYLRAGWPEQYARIERALPRVREWR
jgi:phosphoadenosine phosphosulfate reductase